MTGQLKVFRSLPKLLIASLAFCVGATKASAAGGHGGGGHGGGAGHVAGFHGGHGFHGGYGYHGFYGYPYYGFYGFGLGLGLGYGVGYGYGYPYYGYPYYGGYYYGGYPYYGYPSYGVPYGAGYPLVANPAPGTTPNGTTTLPDGSASPAQGTPPNALPIGLAGQIPTLPGRSSDSELALIVRVPADATVWVNGVKTTQKGTRREFNSTGLEQGRSYTFSVRAQWTGANGSVVETDRRITVQAGERRSLDFMSVPALPPATTPAPAVAKP